MPLERHKEYIITFNDLKVKKNDDAKSLKAWRQHTVRIRAIAVELRAAR